MCICCIPAEIPSVISGLPSGPVTGLPFSSNTGLSIPKEITRVLSTTFGFKAPTAPAYFSPGFPSLPIYTKLPSLSFMTGLLSLSTYVRFPFASRATVLFGMTFNPSFVYSVELPGFLITSFCFPVVGSITGLPSLSNTFSIFTTSFCFPVVGSITGLPSLSNTFSISSVVVKAILSPDTCDVFSTPVFGSVALKIKSLLVNDALLSPDLSVKAISLGPTTAVLSSLSL